MSALNAALCRRGIILWLAAVLLLASRSTHSAPVYDQDTTHIAEYDGATVGCYFNFQRYQEGDRIMTSEPCLNCTCHNRMLMCYLKVCPFTKAIGQDCTVEKRPDQCCPVITCPQVPVQLLTSTTSAPATSDSTEVGFHDNYGCHVDERFYADGAMLPLDHHNPCELCYCIRNRTTCVMQECTLQVAGCKPVYQPGVCCPIKYNCEYDEESSTTVGTTPGLIVTTTLSPGVLPQCYYKDKVYEDGDLIYSTQPCQHCYCFRGEIACAVQDCGTPMQEHGKNCTALPPPEGKCCPTTYQCEEGLTTVYEGEEQYPQQVLRDHMTESPMLIDQEDQQHSQEETFPDIDKVTSHAQGTEEEEGTIGTIEQITQGHILSTEKPEEQPTTTLSAEEIETTTVEKESTPFHEHVTETSPVEVTSEKAGAPEAASEAEAAKTETPTTVQGAEEGLVTEAPITELPETSSVVKGLQPEEEVVTTEHVSEEHISTEESVIEKEHGTPATAEKEESTELSISEVTEGPVKEEESTSPHEGLPTQTLEEEKTEVEKTTEEEQITVTKAPERPEISTEIVEKATSPAEEPDISTESVTEQSKESESKLETIPDKTLATETESPKEEETVTVAHEISSTEQIVTEKEEVSHPTEAAVTEEVQSTSEVSGPPQEQPIEKEQKPVTGESEKEQRPEEPTSEHAVIKEEQATVGAKKEDAGLTESPAEEESTPEIPTQGPTGIPIPEQSPKQKAEDESVYHVTEDYHGITRPEVSPDNLITEPPQKIPTTHLPQEETTLVSSEETVKPIATEGPEILIEETAKPIPEEATEINLPSQSKPEITTSSKETEMESTPAITEVQASTESSATTVAHEKVSEEEVPEKTEKSSVPEETGTEVPQTEVQSTEKIPSDEEMPTKELDVEESSERPSEISGEKGEKEMKNQSSEEEIETQPPVATEPETASETLAFIPMEHLTVPSVLGEEHATEGEHVTTVITSAEQSTHVPEKEIEIVPVEKEKPVEEHATEQSTATTSVTVEEGKELQTEEPVLEEKQTTEMIKTIEDEEKPTTWVPTVEEGITEQPEQYSTQKAAEEAAVTESYGLKETEGTKGASTESAEQQTETTITEKEPSKETVELQPTEVIGIEQTELPAEHPIETGEIEKEGEEKIPVSTEKVQTETPAIETGVIETTTVEKETEKVQTEPSVSGEYIPSQSSIPSDRKEDQEPIEPEINEEQMTQKPSLGENEVTETYEESQKPIISSEEETSHVSPTEEAVTESSPPEEKPVEIGTTEVAGIGEAVTQPEPEIASEQPEKVTTEQLEQEEETQRPITEQQPEIHERKETETSSSVTHEQPSVTPVPQKPVEGAESESTTIPVLISEASTKLPEPVEESTKEHEGKIPIENEIIPSTEFVPSEEEQSTTHEQATQPSVTEEKPTEENIEKKIIPSTEFVPSEEEQSTTHEQATQPSVTEEKPTEENIEKEIISSTEFVPSEEEQSTTHEQATQPSVTEEKPTEENIEKEIIPSTEFVPSEEEQPKTHEQATQPSVTEEKPTGENIEKEIIPSTEFVPSEDEQPKIHEQATQPSVTEEKPTDENIEKEIISSTEFVPSEEEQSTIHEQATQPSVTEEKPTEENIEKEIIPSTEFIPSEEEQPKTHEQATQPSVTEEKPTGEKSEAEGPTKISTEEDITPETPKVSITEEQSQKPDEEEIAKEMTTETPIHEEQEEYSTISLPETPEVKITTEISPKEVPQYSTETIPEEISVEEESKSEIVPRPSGIPGEGNCLVEGQSYSNNSAVPPANACQVSCRCISSIVQCELVQCPAPPAHLSNCMPVHTSGESCCPMYACDSAPTDELESESHVIEPHPEEEDQKNVPPMEISTEVEKESSTLVGEMSTPESRPAEVTILPSEEEITTETQQTTLKPIETVYEQPSTVGQPEEHPEEHTISPVPETSQESTSQVLEEEHTVSPVVSGETTEGKISEEGESITELASTEQPKEEIAEKQTPVSGEIITSTHAPVEQELYSTEEGVTVSTVTEKEETSTPVKVEEASIPAETEEEVTIAVDKKDEITPIKEQEKPTEEGVEKQSTLKPVEEIEKEQPEEEKVSTEAISEEPVSAAEHETSTKLEEIVTEKPEILEEQKTVKPTEYEGTSVPEIQSTTEHKPESETGYKEEIEQEAVTLTEAAQTEEPESQTKLPGIAPSEVETQEPITPAAESTTLIPDHTGVEKAPKEEYTTVKSMEESTKTEPEISTQAPATEEEHVTVPVLSVEAETATEETPVEESIPEVSHEETSPESTERAIEKETTEHVEEHTEPSITEHEEKPSVTKSPEEKPSETESPISTEEPVKTIEVEKTTEAEAEYGKPTETSITQQPESTQISVEEHPEATPEIESHTSELPAEEHTVAEEVSTTSAPAEKEAGEQPTTPIAKETEPSLSEAGQPIVPEVVSETPAAEKEHVTVSDEEQTTKSEEHPVEEQTVASTASSEEEKIESGVSTEEATSITSQEEQATEKTVESAKPETELPGLAEEHTIIPVVVYEEEKKQKPEVGITEEPSKEVSAMVPEVTEAGEKETTEEAVKDEAVTSASATEEHPSMTEHTEQKEVEPFVKVHEPMEFETTIAPKEQEPEEESQVTEASLPKHPVSEEATTILIPEEPIVTVKTEEKEETHEQTTLSAAEEVSKPATEASEVEKPEEEVTIAETERPEEPVTRVEVSSTENAEEVPSETERPVEPEQETESPEQQQDETTTKAIESVVTEGELLEVVPVEVTPEAGEKPTEASAIGEEEEAHSTEPSVSVETTSVHEEEQPSITKLQPTEGPLPSEEETQSSQPEGEETHPAVPEESYPGVAEEPQFTTEHAPETSVTIKTEEYPETEKPETSSEAAAPVEGPIKVSGVPTELLEETSTVGPVLPEESESQIPIKSEEVPQPETPVEEPIIKTQPIPTELPTGQITEEIPEDEIHPQEEEKIDQPHIDHFATMKPETNYSAGDELTPGTDDKHLQPAPATLAPDIPEYPGQSGSDEYNPDFPVNGGSFLSPGSDYYGDDLEPGACRYSGKIYVSAQQIPRDDPCDFCFCFRSDIICLQQSCPPPIPGCHEEPISGFCCPRYECPVSMATALNLTTTTTTTTTTLPPHFHAHAYKGAARRSGCQVRGQAYRVGEVIKSASGPCLRCICGGDGNMNCNPRVCSPEPMLKQMIAATTEAKRRR